MIKEIKKQGHHSTFIVSINCAVLAFFKGHFHPQNETFINKNSHCVALDFRRHFLFLQTYTVNEESKNKEHG